MLTKKPVCIDQERLWASHMAMAEIGALSKGGSCRLALSSEDKRGRDLFVSWCREADLDIRMDQIGNIYARRSGRNNSLPPAATGSHLDTQPHGGKFDGIYGVLAGLEVIRTLDDYDIETEAPIEVIVWTNEEGARFEPGLMGSQVFSGRLALEQVHSITTIDGTTVLEDLHAIGYFGDEISSNDHELACFIECHIEQGPILEQKNLQIGVVTKVQGIRGFSVKVKGFDNHAGTTPLDLRQDALVGAAKMVVRLNEIGLSGDDFTRVTVGRFEILPNSMSSIPGEVFFSIDLRHPDLDVLDNFEQQFREEILIIASDLDLEVDVDRFMAIAPTDFDPETIETVHREVKKLGYSHQKMLSGAGHDAMNIASVAPTAMIFVPCEGGISHNEAEAASPEDLAAGANVLLHSLLSYSGRPS